MGFFSLIFVFLKKSRVDRVSSQRCWDTYLFVCLDNLDDLIINFPPEQLLSLTPIVDRVEKHQLHTQLPQPANRCHIHAGVADGTERRRSRELPFLKTLVHQRIFFKLTEFV